jgi:hypothetical protein
MNFSDEDRRRLAAMRSGRFFAEFPWLRQTAFLQNNSAGELAIQCCDRPTADRAVAEFRQLRDRAFVVMGVSRVSVRLGGDVLADVLISFPS